MPGDFTYLREFQIYNRLLDLRGHLNIFDLSEQLIARLVKFFDDFVYVEDVNVIDVLLWMFFNLFNLCRHQILSIDFPL